MLKDRLMEKGLSRREAEVAIIVYEGISNKEIADRLFVTDKAIKFHLTNIYRKLRVKQRGQLILMCAHITDAERKADLLPCAQLQAV